MANKAWLEKPSEPVTGGRRALNGEQTIANFVTPNVISQSLQFARCIHNNPHASTPGYI